MSTKILIAGCSTPTIATNIQSHLDTTKYKVNVIGDLKNLNVSIILDKPDVLFIHFHEFTHNAIELSREIYEKHNIRTIFIISLDSFKNVLEEIKTSYNLGHLSTPVNKEELKNLIEQI